MLSHTYIPKAENSASNFKESRDNRIVREGRDFEYVGVAKLKEEIITKETVSKILQDDKDVRTIRVVAPDDLSADVKLEVELKGETYFVLVVSF